MNINDAECCTVLVVLLQIWCKLRAYSLSPRRKNSLVSDIDIFQAYKTSQVNISWHMNTTLQFSPLIKLQKWRVTLSPCHVTNLHILSMSIHEKACNRIPLENGQNPIDFDGNCNYFYVLMLCKSKSYIIFMSPDLSSLTL